MPWTLAIENEATDRDYTFTVAGIVPPLTIELYYSKVDEDAPGDWTLAYSGASASETLTVPVNGYYWFYAKIFDTLVLDSITNFVRVAITSGEYSVYDQIVNAVTARLQDSVSAGGFPRITDPARVVSSYQYIPAVFTANVPGIAVVGNGNKIGKGGTNEEDDKIYPVLVICADRANVNTPRRGETDPYYLWQERIEQLFEHKRIPTVMQNGIPIVGDVDISYPETVQFILQTYHDVRVALQLGVQTREARTL